MSASEKLKALEARVGDGLIPYELEDALPQIVAVVEAAEHYDEAGKQMGGPSALWPLGTALAALEEALT